MWFAAFQNYQHNPWLVHLAAKMLKNDPIVDSLLLKNPFQGQKPPKFIRARHYQYNFSKLWGKESNQGRDSKMSCKHLLLHIYSWTFLDMNLHFPLGMTGPNFAAPKQHFE